MKIREALRRGVDTLSRSKWMLFLFYAATTAAALLIVAPFMAIAFQSLGESAWAHEMNGNLDLSWISELLAAHGVMPVTPVTMVLIGASIIAVVVYLFLLGGALQVFCTGDPFFAGCGRNFWSLFRLGLVSLLFYGAAFIVYGRLGALGRKIWGEGSEATPLIHWSWFCAAVGLCLICFVNLIFDYARIRMVAEDRRKAFRATFAAIRFVWKNLRRTAGLYAVVCVIAALCFAVYLGISHSFAQSSLILVLLLLLVRQAMVMAKVWARLLFYSSAVEMYATLKPPLPVMMPPTAEPAGEEAAMTSDGSVEVALSPALGITAFDFITSWNQTPECRAAAEAGLSSFNGTQGVVFDPERLRGNIVMLNRLAEGVDSASLHELIRHALDSLGSHGSLQIHEGPATNGSRQLTIDASQMKACRTKVPRMKARWSKACP